MQTRSCPDQSGLAAVYLTCTLETAQTKKTSDTDPGGCSVAPTRTAEVCSLAPKFAMQVDDDDMFPPDMFIQFELPPKEPFAHHVDLSNCNARNASEARSIADYLCRLASGTHSHNPQMVCKLDIKWSMRLMCDMAWRLTIGALQKMDHLSIVNLERSRLSGTRLVDLLYLLLQLPVMQASGLLNKNPAAEISIKSNGCDDATISMLAKREQMRLIKNPARGVRKLTLTDNLFSDKVVARVVKITPNLSELHLSGNENYTGTNLKECVCDWFAPLTRLGLDRTGVDADGIASLMQGLERRALTSNQPLIEVWLRMPVHPQDAAWNPLINLCFQVKYRGMFLLKHDMQKSICIADQNAVCAHDNVIVRLFVNGASPVDIDQHDTLCTVSIGNLAQVAVNELNIVSRDDVIKAHSRAVNLLRQRYKEALAHLVDSPTLAGRVFKVASNRMVVKNRFTGETKVVSEVGTDILGQPARAWNVIVEVVTEQDASAMHEHAAKRMRLNASQCVSMRR